MSLTLAEFKDSETARQVSPKGSWTRAVPIQDKDQKWKKVGDLAMELARLFGSCVYCPLNRCNKVRDNVCRFETSCAGSVAQVIRKVQRELDLQKLPVANLLDGKIVLIAYKKQVEQDMEDGQIDEEQAEEKQPDEDDLFTNNQDDVLYACGMATNSTNHKLDFEEKEH
jgi:hypothetical protein